MNRNRDTDPLAAPVKFDTSFLERLSHGGNTLCRQRKLTRFEVAYCFEGQAARFT